MSQQRLQKLLKQVRSCRECSEYLPFEPRPVVRAHSSARLLIVGQAPGTRVNETGIPWNDPSGDRLRDWMQVDREIFYDEKLIAIVPMGFCYPGKGKSGDLPPRPECAELWHGKILECLPDLELILLVGAYAQRYYLNACKPTLTETVKDWKTFLPHYLPLPHPSPRNQIWLKRNSWFVKNVVPALRIQVKTLLSNDDDSF